MLTDQLSACLLAELLPSRGLWCLRLLPLFTFFLLLFALRFFVFLLLLAISRAARSRTGRTPS